MSVLTADYVELVTKLPPGGRLCLEDVPWNEYESLLAEVTDQPHYRISYDQGELEIMSTSARHEIWKVLFAHLLAVLAEELNLNLYSLGSMTFKLPQFAQGVEPDDCFYLHRAAQVMGLDELDLQVDPGPELIIEIDITHGSLDKFPIYANLGVEEVWRRDKKALYFYRRAGASFEQVETSDLFPFLTAADLLPFLEQGKQQGVVPMIRAFRHWVRQQAHG